MNTGLVRFAVSSALLLLGCSPGAHVIGAACPGADGPSKTAQPCTSAGAAGASASDAGLSFAVDLDQSGVSQLSAELELSTGMRPALLRLRGENATPELWPADDGVTALAVAAAPVLGLDAPFTDGTQAVGLAADSTSYVAGSAELGSLGTDDFALELVLRAVPGRTVVDRRNGGVGWALKLSAEGVLALELADDQGSVQLESEPLTAHAWYHCLFWVSRAAGGRSYCNGREGAAIDLSTLGSLDPSTSALALGGGAAESDDRVQLALLTLFDAKTGGLGAATTWPEISRKRFAALTGVSPRVALGSALPELGLRDCPAYLDLQRDTARKLFLVGPDWPRVACRNDTAGVRDCGYLSEPKRTRWLPPEAAAWTASELTVLANQGDFADGERRMAALVPSAASAPHTLEWSGTYGGARQALSFFVRAGSGQFVAASVSNRAAAIFDVRAGTVLSAPPTVRATIEPWDGDLFRCAYVFEPGPGALSYRIELLGDPSQTPFSGDGTSAWLQIAGLELDIGANPGSLLAADTELADQLTFIADDGNLPSSNAVSQTLRVLLPAGPRLTDQAALSLNLGGQFDNQVELYVTGDTGELKFWGLQQGDTHWAFIHPASFVDGLRHAVEADWNTGAATLSVDGVAATQAALIANDPPFTLDRIDVGFSASSSGSLEGLVAGIEIGAGAP